MSDLRKTFKFKDIRFINVWHHVNLSSDHRNVYNLHEARCILDLRETCADLHMPTSFPITLGLLSWRIWQAMRSLDDG